MSQVQSAFYWREQMKPLEAVGARRSTAQVDILQKRALALIERGWTRKAVGEHLGIPVRYVTYLVRGNDRCLR